MRGAWNSNRWAARLPAWLGGLLLAALFPWPVAAELRDYYFQNVGSGHGLAQNTVHAMVQDDSGFVWIATQGGLNRFDGHELRLFQHDPADPGSLQETFLTALAQGRGGELWVGTNSNFLARLDLGSGRIERFDSLKISDDPRRNAVAALRVDAEGGLWLGTQAGIEHFDPASGNRTEVLRLLGAGRSDRRGIPRSIDLEFDSVGMLWAATDGGLFRIEPRSRRYQRIGPERPAFGLLRDRNGQFWAGTIDGLWRADVQGSIEPVKRADGSQFNAVWRLAGDDRGRVWMALLAGGLVRFDPRDGSEKAIHYQPGLPAGLPGRSISSLMVDASGLLWVGGESTGIATTPADGARFPLLLDLDERSDPVAGNNYRALLEGEPGQLWAGAESEGLKRIDTASGRFENFIDVIEAQLQPDVGLRRVRVVGLAPGTRPGLLWVSTDHGLFEFDPAARSARREQPPADARIAENDFRYALRDRDGDLWLGTFSRGLVRFRPATREWQVFAHDPARQDSLSHPLVTHIMQDSRGLLWVSTVDGLNRIDPASGQLQRILHQRDRASSLSGNLVRGVVEASDGRFWVATHSGLSVTEGDPWAEQPAFQRITSTQGLPSNTVYGVLEDGQGWLWASTNLGLARVDPRSRVARHFSLRDGLQDLEFNGGAQLRLRDGRLAFGGIHGINLFAPERVVESDFSPNIALTALRVGDGRDNRAPLGTPSELRVEQTDRVVRMRFAALDFTAPERNRFEYRLEGFDSGWNDAGNSPEATYTNLDPGQYRLRVRGSNYDGRWSEHELELPLVVVPAWWNSLPARVGYLLLAAALVWLLWHAQRRRRRQELQLMHELQQREERLKLALWGSGDEFWDWNIRNNTLFRLGADQLLGMTEQQELSTDDWRNNAVHPDDLQRVQETLQAHITGRTPAFESEHRIRNAQGQWVWIRSRGKLVERGADGQPLRMAGTARDITQNRQAEGERRIASEVLRSMNEAVAVVDLGFRFVSVNPAFSRITGYESSEVQGQSSAMLDSSQQPPEFYRRLRETVDRLGHWKGELWQRRKDGSEFLSWLEVTEVRDSRNLRTHFVAVTSDITEKKRAEQELRYLANYDPLTGLPNRTLLSERLARAVVRARRNEGRIAVLFLDLDRFKDINDSLGHSAGDRILKSAAARLLATVRESDTVARLGGDEFTVVLEDIHDQAAAEQMAARIVQAFQAPLDLDGRSEVAISPSIGIALFPDHAQVPVDLLKFADTAMYAAKEKGRNTWQVYSEEMDAESRQRMAMLSALRRALDRNELSLVYQPRLDLAENRITGVEALLRWHSAELGPVPPASFIPLAEETGLILPIGEWVLREAAHTVARWRKLGHEDLVISVNVSVLQFLRGRLEESVAAAVAECAIPARCIELEVTESMVMANAEQAVRVLQALKAQGSSIAIDDFGTGYSSLSYLKRLPLDTLKIDKEFVGDITSDPDDAAITATVITMAHSLGLRVVAEGVETAEQLNYLREHLCDEIQGYWLARPLAEGDCLRFLAEFGRS